MVTRASAVLAFLVGTSLLVACGSDRSGDEVHVVTLGDSVAFDADPGIRAALEAIDGVTVDTRSFGGVGLLRPGFDEYLGDALDADPDVLTLMLGGWDLDEAMDNPGAYRERVEEVAARIIDSGAHLVWIGMPVTPPDEGIEEHRLHLNGIVRAALGQVHGADYLDSDRALASADGTFVRQRFGLDGTLQPIRKLRDGVPDGHLCPTGAARMGQLVADELHTLGITVVEVGDPTAGHPQGEWWVGEWTSDPRYDDPPGGCDA
jgi:hypothetical protein